MLLALAALDPAICYVPLLRHTAGGIAIAHSEPLEQGLQYQIPSLDCWRCLHLNGCACFTVGHNPTSCALHQTSFTKIYYQVNSSMSHIF